MSSLDKHVKQYVVTADGEKAFSPTSNYEDIAINDILIQPVNRDEEKDLYQNLYNRIYPYIKPETDFGSISQNCNLNRRKLRQALLFRLGSGEVMQLFGLKKGSCFVCEGKLAFENTMEPFCLKCLQKVDQHFQNILQKRRQKDCQESDHGFETNGSLQAKTEKISEPTLPISQAEYNHLVEELNHL